MDNQFKNKIRKQKDNIINMKKNIINISDIFASVF